MFFFNSLLDVTDVMCTENGIKNPDTQISMVTLGYESLD